jgi:hypothetical protein
MLQLRGTVDSVARLSEARFWGLSRVGDTGYNVARVSDASLNQGQGAKGGLQRILPHPASHRRSFLHGLGARCRLKKNPPASETRATMWLVSPTRIPFFNPFIIG